MVSKAKVIHRKCDKQRVKEIELEPVAIEQAITKKANELVSEDYANMRAYMCLVKR